MHFRDGQSIFDGFAGENGLAATVTGVGEPFQVPIFKTTANYFDVLGLRKSAAGFFAPGRGSADVASSRAVLESRLGGDPMCRRGLTLDGVSHTIVGVIQRFRSHGQDDAILDDQAVHHPWVFL